MPRLSVIMPVFNGERTIERSLRSMLGEGVDTLEVIAVDQASSDGSREILERFSSSLPLTVIDAPESRSWLTNTNIGLRAARAELVTMLHQDDIWLPGRARKLIALANRFPEADLIVHPAVLIDDADRRIGTMAPPFGAQERAVGRAEALRVLAVQNTVALPAAAFRRAAAIELGGLSELLWYTGDWDFWLRLGARGPIAWSPEPLAGFRIHADSQTVRRSVDLADFAAQLDGAVEPHLYALPDGEALRLRRFTTASNMLNVFLAGRYHGQKVSPWPFIKAFVPLGPVGWYLFLRRTQILSRLIPRLRLLLAR